MQLLQSIAAESSDGEYSDSEPDEVSNVIADIQNEEDYSDLDDEYTDQEVPTETDDGARARSNNDNDEKNLLGKDGSPGSAQFSPKSMQDNYSSTILLKSMQDLHHISHSASYVIFFVHILFNEPMLNIIQKCTTAEAYLATKNNSWTVVLDKLDKFMGLIVA